MWPISLFLDKENNYYRFIPNALFIFAFTGTHTHTKNHCALYSNLSSLLLRFFSCISEITFVAVRKKKTKKNKATGQCGTWITCFFWRLKFHISKHWKQIKNPDCSSNFLCLSESAAHVVGRCSQEPVFIWQLPGAAWWWCHQRCVHLLVFDQNLEWSNTADFKDGGASMSWHLTCQCYCELQYFSFALTSLIQ